MPQPNPVRPRVKDAKAYEALIRREILDPLFASLRAGLADAVGVAQALRALDSDAYLNEGRLIPSAEVMASLKRVEGYHRARLLKTFKAALGIDVSRVLTEPQVAAFLREKVSENVNLIKTIPPRAHASLKKRLLEELGEAPFDRQRLTALLRKEYRSSGYNVRRLARDQTTKTIGNLTEIRHRQMGLAGYRWGDSGDRRVRKTHRANNGLFFRWDSPPAVTGHPGNDIQCRCVAYPAVLKQDRERLARIAK